MKKTILCIGFVLFFQIVNSIPINNAYQFNTLNSRVVTLSIDSLKKLVKEMQASIIILQSESRTLDSINKNETKTINQNKVSILELNRIYQKQKTISIHGAIILLLGLFLEIIGAVLVSSENLTKETLKIRPYNKTEYRLGEWGGNKNLDNKNISFQVFGTYILILGFALQFIGTFFVVSQNFIFNIIFIPIAIIVIILLSYIIIEKIGGLSFFFKLETSIQNIKGSLMFAFENELQRRGKIVCEGCFNKNKADISYIGYIMLQDQPFMRPEGFFIGHKKCIEQEIKTCEKLFWDTKYSIHIEELNKFFMNDFSDIKRISEKDKQEKKFTDSEFVQIVARLKLIDERIYKK